MPATEAARVCVQCGETETNEGLVVCAREGTLLLVCARCFYLRELNVLTSHLPAQDSTRGVLNDGLRTLYELVKTRVEEIVAEGRR